MSLHPGNDGYSASQTLGETVDNHYSQEHEQ